MKLELKRIDEAFHLQGTNEEGATAFSDASTKIGGGNKAFRPMQLMLMSVASCSSIDILSILRKQKLDVKDFYVTIEGEREADKVPSLFTHIHIHYKFAGQIPDEKAKRAIDLSITKYCSASRTLEKAGAKITTSYEIMNS